MLGGRELATRVICGPTAIDRCRAVDFRPCRSRLSPTRGICASASSMMVGQGSSLLRWPHCTHSPSALRTVAASWHTQPPKPFHSNACSNLWMQNSSSIVSGLPRHLRNATVLLELPSPAAGGPPLQVFVLGISHCSRVSATHIQQLIAEVKPDVVMLELDAYRTGLLYDPASPQPSMWTAGTVSIEGLPQGLGWPMPSQLLSLLKSRNGNPVSPTEIEEDAITLLSTGVLGRRG
jgi:hypothetical protein